MIVMIEGVEFLGVFGLLLLVIAWLPETIEMIKTQKAHLNKRFIILYITGSTILAIYSYFIQNIIFMFLNAFIALIALLNSYYEFFKK